MVGKRSTNYCKSRFTSSCCCESDNNLIEEGYLDQEKTSDNESDPCKTGTFPATERDTITRKKVNKEHVQIKLVEHKKPRKTEDPKILAIIPTKPCSSGFNDIARKAASALSNCISYVFPGTSTEEKAEEEEENEIQIKEQENETITHKQPEIRETRKYKEADKGKRTKAINETKIEAKEVIMLETSQQVDDETKNQQKSAKGAKDLVDDGQEEQMEDLIENFKVKALNADDQMFDKLLETLKKELDLLACSCTSADSKVGKSSRKFEHQEGGHHSNGVVGEETGGKTETNKDCMSKEELDEILAELKVLLDKNFCECDRKEVKANVEILEVNERASEQELEGKGLTCPKSGAEGCGCKQNKDEETPMSKMRMEDKLEKNTIVPDYTDFFERIMSKLEAISFQCLDKTGRSSKNMNISEVSEKSTSSFSGGSTVSNKGSSKSNTSRASSAERKKNKKKLNGGKTAQGNNNVNNKNVNDSPAENDQNSIPLEEFVNLANELKDTLEKSACKCTQSSGTDCLNKEMNVLQISPLSTNEEQKEKEISIHSDDTFVSLPPGPGLSLLERVAADTFTLSDLFEKQTISPKKPVLESPAESFYSASSNDPNLNAKGVEVGVNTECKCQADQVVQTSEGIEVSYGVVCIGKSMSEEQERPEVTDVQIRRKIYQDGELERIKVRVQLKNGKIEADAPEIVYRKEKDVIERSSKFIKTFADYNIKYETTETDIEEPKVVTDGDQIKIFIPLKCDATNPCGNMESNGEPKHSFDSFGIDEKKLNLLSL